ncbi:MAG: MurT ligase domain-containing protein, partial [Bacillota bacterium]|nr:MurT ligase domain-containing protein [Bacillota bacterium]
LEEQGMAVITNPSGANLDSGLTTTLLDHLALLRRGRSEAGSTTQAALVFEIDEAFFAKLAVRIKPDICIVTNFFRDQLDRFGELQHTRDLIARGLAESKTTAVLCADDSLCASLGKDRPYPTAYFGMKTDCVPQQSGQAVLESPFCTFCGARYHYDGLVYGHLGLFTCPDCGYHRPEPDLVFEPAGSSERKLTLRVSCSGQMVEFDNPVPGLHNAYNATGALLAALQAGLPLAQSAQALSRTQAAFGRMERFAIGDREVCLILVKNPVGMERALEFVSHADDAGAVMMMLNANDPDGRDVSWIWDVHFEESLLPGRIGISGIRCHDLALRLYYAGKKPDELLVTPEHLNLFDQLLAVCPAGRCLYLLPNYTAMLAIRADFVKRYRLRDFWR